MMKKMSVFKPWKMTATTQAAHSAEDGALTRKKEICLMIRASILAMLLATSGVAAHFVTAQVRTTSFKAGASSSGWIDFTTYTNLGIFLPVKINGHEAMAWLWGGPSTIDKSFAASIGLQAKTDAATPVGEVDLQVGDLTLHNTSAKLDELQAEAHGRYVGHPVTFRLGEEVFNQMAVDIDYANHRIAFRDPKTVTKPAGAIEVPLIELDGERVLPLSVNGATPAQFELELGNVIGPLMVTRAYAETHKLLEGHPTSQRLSGPYSETVVSIDQLSFAGVDFPKVPIAIVPDTELPPASITGGVGLPLLAKFRLIIDYSHNRLYAIPNATAVKTPIEKDRIGLILGKKDGDFAVVFVAPASPAAAAGFKKGDKVAQIDGKPFAAWAPQAIIRFHMAEAGTTHTFTMGDGTVRQVKAADFF
jgi:hypothetical protein